MQSRTKKLGTIGICCRASCSSIF